MKRRDSWALVTQITDVDPILNLPTGSFMPMSESECRILELTGLVRRLPDRGTLIWPHHMQQNYR